MKALRCTAGLAALALACGGPQPGADAATAGPPPESEAPVALNGDSPIDYPATLFEQHVEGDVVLRLFIDSTGRMVAESTRISESSGYPALDSAALAGAGRLRFAPAKRRGIAVATAFLQPIEFRHPAPGGGPPAATVRTAPATPPPAPPPAPRVQPITPQPRPDSTPPRRDSTPARRDTTPVRDTTVKTDTNAVTP